MPRSVTPTTVSEFREHGARVRVMLGAEGGTYEGIAEIDTGSPESGISAKAAHRIGAPYLFEQVRRRVASGANPAFPLHGPLTANLGGTTFRFPSAIGTGSSGRGGQAGSDRVASSCRIERWNGI
jgi:hypothetical protein